MEIPFALFPLCRKRGFMADFTSFQKGLNKLGIVLNNGQFEQFYQYYEMLIEKNKVMNLTAITDYEEVIHKHFLDSLSIVLWKDFQKQNSIIDIGTGAGFPGIPLKIAFPKLDIVLLDSLNKRVNFLNEVIDELGLKGIQAVHGRAEDFARKPEYREQFDCCVSRAVANLATLSEYCIPFVKTGGYFVPYKSGKADEEIIQAKGAISILGGKVEERIAFELPGTDMDRTLVILKKEKNISKKYPRKAGQPSKEPLK